MAILSYGFLTESRLLHYVRNDNALCELGLARLDGIAGQALTTTQVCFVEYSRF